MDNRIAMADGAGAHNYAYDQINQLIQAIHPQPPNPLEQFAYDTLGNRIGQNQIYNAANRLLEDDTAG